MRCLFIDLASHGSASLTTSNGCIACVSEKEVLSLTAIDHRAGDHELIPFTEKTLQAAGWTFEQLTRIACVVGPGGFTSLRVGVAFANTLADQLHIPIAGVHQSDLYRARAEDVLWLHSTKRDQLFVRGGEWKEPTLITVTELAHHIPKGSFWMGELIPEHRTALSSVAEVHESLLRPIVDVLPPFLARQSFADQSLEPWYGRGW